jgi:hypothetical protein
MSWQTEQQIKRMVRRKRQCLDIPGRERFWLHANAFLIPDEPWRWQRTFFG